MKEFALAVGKAVAITVAAHYIAKAIIHAEMTRAEKNRKKAQAK